MKKTLAFLLCIGLFIATCSFQISAETNTYSITQLDGKYKTQGRTELVDGTLFMDWSASGIEFSANCSGDVSIKVNTARINSGDKNGIYFTVIVDGVVQHEDKRIPKNNDADSWKSNSTNYPFKIEEDGISEFTIAENLKSGKHTFEIYNQTESFDGSFGIQSISLNGEFLAEKGNNDLYIEFVGDSVTVSVGNLSTGGQAAPLYQDATRGWAYMTAKKLDADWSIIGQNGITASNGIGWAGVTSVSMQTVYPKTRYHSDKNADYNFNRKADVVVLGLGTNDFLTYESGGKTTDYLKSEFKNMLDLIKKHNPDAKIVWIYGMLTNDADSLIGEVIAEAGGADKGFYTLSLPQNTSGGQGHPNLAGQRVYADKVSKFIAKILGLESEDDNTQSTPSSNTSSSANPNENSQEQTPNGDASGSQGTSSDDTAADNQVSDEDKDENGKTDSNAKPPYIILIGGAVVLVAGAGVAVYLLLKRKNK